MTTQEFRKSIDPLIAEYRYVCRNIKEEKRALAEVEEEVSTSEEAQIVIQHVAEEVQKSAHSQIASVVSKCLQTVFGDDAYEFKIDFQRKRGKTEARLLFVRDGLELDPIDSAGGGVVDVAAFALRIACLLLSRPRKRRLVVADEPFKHLSKEYRPAVRQMLLALAEEMGVQFIIVSHSPEFVCGKVVEI